MGINAGGNNTNKYDYLLILIIGSLSLGVAFSPLTVSRLVALFLVPYVISHFNKIVRSLPAALLFFLICWLVCASVGILFNSDIVEGVIFWIYNTLSAILIVCIFTFSKNAKKPILSIVKGWIVVVAITSPVAVWEIVTGSHLPWNYYDNLIMNTGEVQQRVYASVTFGNLNTYVVVLSMGLNYLLLGIYLFKTYRKSLSIATFLTLLIVIINASRGGLLCISISLVIAFIYFWKYRIISKSKLTGIVIVLIVGLILSARFILSQIITRVIDSDSITNDDSRLHIYSNVIKIINNNNGLGCGLGSVESELLQVAPMDIPAAHNFMLEYIVQYGIIPGMIFLSLLIFIFHKGLHKQTTAIKMLTMCVGITFLPLTIINSTYIAGAEIWIYIACFIAILYSHKRCRTNSNYYETDTLYRINLK